MEFILAAKRWKAFCDALDAPPRVIPALRAFGSNEVGRAAGPGTASAVAAAGGPCASSVPSRESGSARRSLLASQRS